VLHAATSSATPKALPAPAASRARADIRFAMKFRIAFVSLQRGPTAPGCAFN
jgi:hypothetical protein